MTSNGSKQENPGRETAEAMRQKAIELHGSGMDWGRAWDTAWLEERIKQWPKDYGDDLQILIYGDFEPPKRQLFSPTLGITVFPENLKNGKTITRSALTVLKAKVKVEGKTVPGVVDAGRRINLLLGSFMVTNWGNSACGWWSWVTHGTGAGVSSVFDHPESTKVIEAVVQLQEPVRRKIESAFYWIREPRQLLMEFYRSDILRIYAGYWNAFECLVDAVTLLKPQQKLTPSQKQQHVVDFIAQRGGKLTPGDIQEAYLTIVNPGFVGKASHALRVCFPEGEREQYVSECFKAKEESLYEVRNAINHGEIDAENPEELIGVGAKLTRLQVILLMMFGRILPFSAPADRKQ